MYAEARCRWARYCEATGGLTVTLELQKPYWTGRAPVSGLFLVKEGPAEDPTSRRPAPLTCTKVQATGYVYMLAY